jgi:aspartyl-tRNA(Asn)/glutamyl-tRNA(Gln) amidotransferase subunit C
MEIDDHLIHKLETLSKLKLSTSEKDKLKVDLENMVSMFGKIAEVDTDGVLPLRHMTDTINVMRDDIAQNQLSHEEALKNAPKAIGRYFAVPKVIE